MPAPSTISLYGTPPANTPVAVYETPEKRRSRVNLLLTNLSGSSSVVVVWLDLSGNGLTNGKRAISQNSLSANATESVAEIFGDHIYMDQFAAIYVRSDSGNVNVHVMRYEADQATNVS